jgi:hypothetical protein
MTLDSTDRFAKVFILHSSLQEAHHHRTEQVWHADTFCFGDHS